MVDLCIPSNDTRYCSICLNNFCRVLQLLITSLWSREASFCQRHQYMRRSLFPLAVLLLFSVSSFAQEIPDYDLGGARKPKPDFSFRKEGQYKRVHQAALRFILGDEIPKSEAFLTQYLKDHPDDEETLFMLGVLNVQRDKLSAGISLPSSRRATVSPRDALVPRLRCSCSLR